MNKNNIKAYSEVYEIVSMLEKEYLDRIPKKVLDFFDETRDKEYKPIIDVNKPLNEQNLQRDTIILLAILDLNYWCDNEEEKKELLEMFNKNTELKIKEQKDLEKKYNPDNLFKKRQQISEFENNETLSMVEYKEQNIIKKILNKILNMFKRSK